MAQFFWTAEDYSLGDTAADVWSGSYAREIKQDVSGQKYLEIIVADEDTYGASFDHPLANDTEWELRVIMANNEELDRHAAFGLGGSTNVATIDTLAADQHNNPSFRLRRFNSGSLSTLTTISSVPGLTPMEVLLTLTGTSFTFSAQEVDGTASGSVTGSKSLDLAFGLFSTRGGTDPFRIYEVGMGTAGDPAASSPVLPPGGLSYGQGFYETVVQGVAAVTDVEIALMNGTTQVVAQTVQASPEASQGQIAWLTTGVTFQGVSGNFNNVRVRVLFGPAVFDVGTWATGTQNPAGNNVIIDQITSSNNSQVAFGNLAGASTGSEPLRFQVLDASDLVLIESVSTVAITAAADHLSIGQASVQNTTGSPITVAGLSLRLDTGNGEVDLASGLTLVDSGTLSSPSPADLQNNQEITLTETQVTYTEE